MRQAITNPLIGADIEAFLKKDNQIISAEGIVHGTKYEPFQFDSEDKYYCTSLDNVLAEFCIPPAKDGDTFLRNILKSSSYLDTLEPGVKAEFIPANRMEDKYLQTLNAQTLGCEPDFDAWLNGAQNAKPEGTSTNLRTAGFHVHIGYDNPNPQTNIEIMKYFDLFVTMPSLLIEPPNERRDLYGKAGSFRHKPYGMEARTLSSFFASKPSLITWVYQNTMQAIEKYNSEEKMNDDLEFLIPEIINFPSKKTMRFAKEIIKNYKITIAA